MTEESAPHAARLARHYDAKYGADREAPGARIVRAHPAPYVTAPYVLGRRLDSAVARWRPQLFAELCLVAQA